ncbi:uncharacterized protein ACR2FA_007796 [Aphomia sociella]
MGLTVDGAERSSSGGRVLANCSNTIVYVAIRQPNVVGKFPLTTKIPKAILIYFVTSFIQSLIYIEILLIWIKSEVVDIKSSDNMIICRTVLVTLLFSMSCEFYQVPTTKLSILCFFWILKGMIIKTALCISSDMLYESISACRLSMIKSSNCYLATRHLSKNVLRTQIMNFKKFSAFGVFTVDAALPLRLGALIATYTIVLLQFAFL